MNAQMGVQTLLLTALVSRFPTDAGDSAMEIAEKISDAFMSVFEPGTYQCESRQNAYDMIADGDTLVSVSSTSLTICANDVGVGVEVGPVDLDLGGVTVDGTDGTPSDGVPLIVCIFLIILLILLRLFIIILIRRPRP